MRVLFLTALFLMNTMVYATNIPTSGNISITACSGTIYDMGGSSGGVTANADGSITIYPGISGNKVSLTLKDLDIDFYNDYLYIYNGTSASGTPMATYQGAKSELQLSDVRHFVATNSQGALTVRLVTGQWPNASDEGVELEIRCVNPNTATRLVKNGFVTLATCDSYITDNGGVLGDATGVSVDSILILPDAPNKRIKITFEQFKYGDWDQMVFVGGAYKDPNNTNNISLAMLGGYFDEETFYARRTDGSFYFFLEQGATPKQGFRAKISCIDGATTPEVKLPISGSEEITTCSETIVDNGSDDGLYLNNTSSSLTIYPDVTEKDVQISFDMFSTESGVDELKVYDGIDNSADLMGTFSGSSLPSDLRATNSDGALTIEFSSNATTQLPGFEITSTCVVRDVVNPPFSGAISYDGINEVTSCDVDITDHSGGPSSNYSNNADGYLVINSTQPGKVIRLEFSRFSTEANYDYVKVYDGNGTSGTLRGSYSGTSIPDYVISASETMTVKFSSDGSGTSTGFAAHASCTDLVEADYVVPRWASQNTSITTCDGLVTDHAGLWTDYLDNCNGQLAILPSEVGKGIKLTFETFDTDDDEGLLVYNDGLSTAGDPDYILKGSTLPNDIISTNSNGGLTLHFVSDGDYSRGAGFSARISCVDIPDPIATLPLTGSRSITTCDTTIYDDGGIGDYSINASGSMNIYPDEEGAIIRIDFIEGYTENNYDYVKVYNGANKGSLIESLSNTFSGDYFISTAGDGSMTVELTSDNTVVKSGFIAQISCIASLPDNAIVMSLSDSVGVITCDGVVFDNGARGNYLPNSNSILTLIPDSPEKRIGIRLLSFDSESGWDYLYIHESDNVQSDAIHVLEGAQLEQTIYSTHDSGALTLKFISDNSIQYDGYEIEVFCEITTSVADAFVEKSNLVYPNPNSGKFDLNVTSNGSVIVYNMIGERVYNIELSDDTNLDLNLDGGIYILEFTSIFGEVTKEKFIVKK